LAITKGRALGSSRHTGFRPGRVCPVLPDRMGPARSQRARTKPFCNGRPGHTLPAHSGNDRYCELHHSAFPAPRGPAFTTPAFRSMSPRAFRWWNLTRPSPALFDQEAMTNPLGSLSSASSLCEAEGNAHRDPGRCQVNWDQGVPRLLMSVLAPFVSHWWFAAGRGQVIPSASLRQAEIRFPRSARTLRISACDQS